MLLAAGLAYWGNVVRTARHAGETGLAYVLEGVLQNGAFPVAAWLLIAASAGAAAPAGPARPRQIAAALAACLFAALPSRQAVILLLLALALLSARTAAPAGRRLAFLLAALALDMAWTAPYLAPLHAGVATLDARLVAALLHHGGIGAAAEANLVQGAGGFTIEILARCASSYPFGGVALAYVVCTLYLGRLPGARDLPFLLASLAAGVVLTECRLAWMALDEADFLWLHEGGGVTLYTLAALALAVLFPLLAARGAPRRAPGTAP